VTFREVCERCHSAGADSRRRTLDASLLNRPDPKQYENLSDLLDALIQQRKRDALDYRKYLQEIVELTKQAKNGLCGASYPKALDNSTLRALNGNLGKDEPLPQR
jgi:type I restriction enzyme R subunit